MKQIRIYLACIAALMAVVMACTRPDDVPGPDSDDVEEVLPEKPEPDTEKPETPDPDQPGPDTPEPENPEPEPQFPEDVLDPAGRLETIYPRVEIQSEYATADKIVDNSWVAVGLSGRDYTPCADYQRLYRGQHSYRFELRGAEDNRLSGYSGGTKGRTEFSWFYATDQDFPEEGPETYSLAQLVKEVYYHGKGHCPQGASMKYEFAIFAFIFNEGSHISSGSMFRFQTSIKRKHDLYQTMHECGILFNTFWVINIRENGKVNIPI